jgi:hypothetical protein
MDCKFVVGQKVVCIDDQVGTNEPMASSYNPLDGLTVGQVYTIRWIGMYKGFYLKEFVGVRVVEIKRDVDPSEGVECCFRASRFKPLEKKKTDISVFKKLLVSSKKKKVLEEVE